MKNETYEEFIAKFNKTLPKTTDECYTPLPVFNKAVEIARNLSKIEKGRHIVLDILPAPIYTKAYGKAFKLKERSRNEL